MMSTMAVMGLLQDQGIAPLLQDRPGPRKGLHGIGGTGARAPVSCRQEDSMSYVQRVLQPGEVVQHTASIHWIVYWPGALCALGALVAYGYGEMQGHATVFWDWVAVLLVLGALFFVIPEWLTWWTTEIAVTNRRIIYKQGFIRRSTMEMHMDKVESVDVIQSIFGRIFDYGNVIVKGTGTGFEPLETIAAPLDLRNHITGV
jgi:hypothetical protein